MVTDEAERTDSASSGERMRYVGTLPPPPSRDQERKLYHKMCLEIVKARPEGGYITEKACRLLRGAILAAMVELPSDLQDLNAHTRLVLRHVTERSVTVPVLAPFVMEQLHQPMGKYPASACGFEYKYWKFLRQRYKDGVLQVLVDWRPTWEPSYNITEDDLRKFQQETRNQRRQHRQQTHE